MKQCGTGELVVAVTGKGIEQNSNLDEIPVDRALARMAQGLQLERIGHEFQSIEQLQMLKLQADVHQEKATLNEGFEVVPAVDDFEHTRQCSNLICAITSNATVEHATNSILPRLYKVVGDRCSSGVLKDSVIESRQLQELVDSSAIIGAHQKNNDKNLAHIGSPGKIINAVNFQVSTRLPKTVVSLRATSNFDHADVMELEHATSTVPKALSTKDVGKKLGNTSASESSGVGAVTGVVRPTATLCARALQYAASTGPKGVKIKAKQHQGSDGKEQVAADVLKPTDYLQNSEARPMAIHSKAKHSGQIHDTTRQSTTGPINSVTKSKNWAGVNRSPTKKQTTSLYSQFVSSTNIGISNSFDALLCEGKNALNEPEHMEQ